MKVIVDKLPTKKEECLFCFTNTLDKYNSHRCLFKVSEYEFGDGLHCSYNDCFLSQGLKCPYLKELFSQEDNDVGEPIYVNGRGELIGI